MPTLPSMIAWQWGWSGRPRVILGLLDIVVSFQNGRRDFRSSRKISFFSVIFFRARVQRNVQLSGFAAAAELAHGHGTFVEVVHRNLPVTKVDGFSHAISDFRWKIGMAKKGPAAEIDAADIPVQLGIVFSRQCRAGEPEFTHMARRGVVHRQEAHASVERSISPAFDAFIENRVGFAGLNMILAVLAARRRR